MVRHSDGSEAWVIPAGDSSAIFEFLDRALDGSNPETAGHATNVTAEPLLANFIGARPMGPSRWRSLHRHLYWQISNRFWDLVTASPATRQPPAWLTPTAPASTP